MRRPLSAALVLVGLLSATTVLEAQTTAHPSYGVYVRLVEQVDGDVPAVAAGVRAALGQSEWRILADYEAGVDPDKCSHRAHVFVVHNPAYASATVRHGREAAFALPLRLAVYQDEGGTHVGLANPQSLTRTIIAESGFEKTAKGAVDQLAAIVGKAAGGKAASTQYGQMRDRGLIGKTMGLIVGGPFPDKVERVMSVDLEPGETVATVADRLYAGLEKLGGKRRWGIRPVYRLAIPDGKLIIIGVTGAQMEAKAFEIVHHGGDDARKDMACPGLDHAPAFPIELVLHRTEDRVDILLIDEMFRMKMYFEDAGNMKFAANMRMPPSIEDEIRDKIEESLYQAR